ncbi:MAG: fibronectin type III domain-containing protein [Bdellovibrionota bacterium]
MKYLHATCLIFFISFALQSMASEPTASCTAANDTQKCAPITSHKDLSASMNSLFPEKQPLTELTTTPTTVELSSPKFLSKLSGPAKLEWKAATGANAYHVQIATDPNFKWLVIDEHFVKTTSFEFTNPTSNTQYFWRVAAINTNNEAMFTKSNFASSAFTVK